MKPFRSVLFFISVFALCTTAVLAQVPIQRSIGKSQQIKTSYTSTIFQNQDKTFGYDILDGGKHLIHQATIPGRSGNKGFKTKVDAEKVANLAISKLKSGLMPPTIEEKELKGLNI